MKVEQVMKSVKDHFRKEKAMEKKNREIRAAPQIKAPCSKAECKDHICHNPLCEDWRVYKNKYLIK